MKNFPWAILSAAALATSLPAQDFDLPTNRSEVTKMAPVVSPDGKVTFSLAAPKASEVFLGGDWAGGRTPMVKDEKGNWTATLELRPQIYSYVFFVDGVRTVDPSNTQLKAGRLSIASSVEVPGATPKLWEMRDVPHGDITTITYRSTAAEDQRRVVVYTPPGYSPDQAAKLPVLYLLHGNGEIESSWVQYGRANLIADNLLAEGKMKPMVIVMPKGHAYKPDETVPEGAQPTNHFKQDLLETIMPLVEKRFRIKTDQQNRAIMGLSMGGIQSFSIGLRQLDLFSYIGIFSAGGRDAELIGQLAANPESANKKIKMLWIACGRFDRGFDGVQNLNDDLMEAGIHHTFKPTDGGHDWINWREYLAEALPLLFQ